MRLSAKNVLEGTVKAVLPGVVQAEVILVLPGGIEITSTITKGSVEALGLKPGVKAYAVIKSSSVLVGVD